MRWKKANHLVYIGFFFCLPKIFHSSFQFSNAIRVKNQFKEGSKISKATKEATKEMKNSRWTRNVHMSDCHMSFTI